MAAWKGEKSKKFEQTELGNYFMDNQKLCNLLCVFLYSNPFRLRNLWHLHSINHNQSHFNSHFLVLRYFPRLRFRYSSTYWVEYEAIQAKRIRLAIRLNFWSLLLVNCHRITWQRCSNRQKNKLQAYRLLDFYLFVLYPILTINC